MYMHSSAQFLTELWERIGREGLFIPAGWAHQVTSAASDSEESEGLHAAVNTWFEPPDY